MKKCNQCGIEYPLSFYKHYSGICKSCSAKNQREYRSKNNDLCTRKYEKTKKGFLMRSYRNMQSRVKGVQKHKMHLYQGLEILNKQSFYEWSLSDLMFNLLFERWEDSGYNQKLTPSVDRIDSSKGYVLQNMRWLSLSQNSFNGVVNKILSSRMTIRSKRVIDAINKS